ncbi:MAG: hypothetical protein M3352_05435 [Bacteroidota bacterium]|nr:hypothetical protein [Bacteroidota bacterium]
MKYFFVFLITVAGCFSCNNNSKTTTTGSEDSSKVAAPVKPVSTETAQCYAGVRGKDSVFLRLNKNNNTVSGDLQYKRFEKDQNKGTIEGMMRGDTLLANYTFMSEGVSSVREIIFLKKGNTLVEGFGDVEEKSGKMVFKNTGAVKFDQSVVLRKKLIAITNKKNDLKQILSRHLFSLVF